MLFADLEIAARTVWGEARGLKPHEQRAIVHVMLNRRDRKIGDRWHSLASVCIDYKQFSCWNENDPNRAKLEKVDLTSRAFRQCMMSVLEALDENDFTHGATHYHAKTISAWWASGKAACYEADGHLFYNNVR